MEEHHFDQSEDAARIYLKLQVRNPILNNHFFQGSEPIFEFWRQGGNKLPNIILASLPTAFEWPEDIAWSLPSIHVSWNQVVGPSRQYWYKSPELRNNINFFTNKAVQYYDALLSKTVPTLQKIMKSRRDSKSGICISFSSPHFFLSFFMSLFIYLFIFVIYFYY